MEESESGVNLQELSNDDQDEAKKKKWDKRRVVSREKSVKTMEESESGVNLQELSNDDQDEAKKKKWDKRRVSLMDAIQRGDVKEITNRLNPRALTNCEDNTLYMAMQASSKLREKADEKGADEEEFTKLANSVDDFSYALLNPLKLDVELRHAFADSLADVLDDAIDMKQKKTLTHPVLYRLMSNRWFGEFRTLQRSSLLSLQYLKWCLLNIWCVMDVLFFPVLLVLFYIIHICRDKARKKRDIAIVFLLNATSEVFQEAFRAMKDSVKYIIGKYGNDRAKYHIIIRHPDDCSFQSHEICFNTPHVNVTALTDAVEELQTEGNKFVPALHKDLQKATEAFESNTLKSDAKKVLVILTDHGACMDTEERPNPMEQAKKQLKVIKDRDVKVITAAFGPHANLRQLKDVNGGADVLHFQVEDEKNFKFVGKGLLLRVVGKDIYDSYRDYFTTPYFVFIRDALSYLVLLGLHFTICLEASSTSFTWIEWAILVFFIGRVLFEREQFSKGKETRKCKTRHCRRVRRNQSSEYLEDLGTIEQSFTRRFSEYMTDRWNILDLITLIIYFATFVLRMVTLVVSESVTDNRSLVIAGYFYGVNTMFLTLRVFGHLMEATKQIGTIQIALFHILSDVVTIFWQFIATILAFSIAITKVYVAEKSFISENNGKELVCSSSGIACWWKMVEHLCWSLMGDVEVDSLESADDPSVMLVKFLYGAFLVMGAILLINMMIALLSNTYQKVQDNSLMEWSFRKAITIQTYSSCDPIPVPVNLVSLVFKCCGSPKCFSWCRKRKQTARKKGLKRVLKRLESMYFAEYGYLFPLTDEGKLDRVLLETERNRQMAHRIIQTNFTAYRILDKNVLPTGPQVLIQETAGRRFLGIGAVWEGYGANHLMPGWSKGTVGYHVDDRKIYHAKDPDKGKQVEDVMADNGDLIGCTIKFEGITNGQVPVVFTLNGRRITEDEIWIDYTPGGKPMYPYIAMGHEGIRVLARMRPSGEIPDEQQSFRTITRESGSRGSDLEPPITMTLHDLKDINETVDADCETFKKEVQEIRNHLNNARKESQALESKLSDSFKRVKKMFFFDERRREEELFDPFTIPAESKIADMVYQLDQTLIETWVSEAEEKERKVPAVVDRLGMIRPELENLGKKTKEKTDEMLEELAQLKSEAQFQHLSLISMNKGLDKNFLEIEELIQGCCTIKKIPLSTLEGSRD